jgi:hydroxymethylbilane synthase
MQTQWVIDQLQVRWPHVEIHRVLVESSGDRIQDRPLHELGGKGLFTKELEIALLEQRIDCAVHSLKDVPVTMPLVDVTELGFAAIPPREDVRDVLVSNKALSLQDLPYASRVGTSSLRRRCQLLAARPDLQITPIRGNIDTRLRKLREGAYDALILAMAGIKRAGLWDEATMTPIPADVLLPAACQGALALQCRREDRQTWELLQTLDDASTHRCVEAERALVRALQGDCHSPIGAWARMEGGRLVIEGLLGQMDGRPPVKRGRVECGLAEVNQAVSELAGKRLGSQPLFS